ncbi:MAG: cell division protein ZipA C-terminal FtsZ-binding domain-containing protein [Pseudomonadota bacterium]
MPASFQHGEFVSAGRFQPECLDSFETKGLALFMSVPCAHHPASVFVKMVTAAKVLCEVLGGELQDQDKKPLSDKGLVIIRRQVEEIDKRMTEYGVVPGSRTALRLFRESLIT